MTNVSMSANDTLHISEVKSAPIMKGEAFVVSSHTAKDLEERGLATRIGDEPEAPASKAEQPPLNKMTAAPANKANGKPKA